MSKHNRFLLSCLGPLLGLIAIYLPTGMLFDGDYVKALAVPAALLVIMVATVVAIGRRFPNYFLYREAIEFWSGLRAWRDRRSGKT